MISDDALPDCRPFLIGLLDGVIAFRAAETGLVYPPWVKARMVQAVHDFGAKVWSDCIGRDIMLHAEAEITP